eukprot:Gb_15971 [translate_table: standard]
MNIESLHEIHAHIHFNGLAQNVFLGTKFIKMYNKFGNLDNAGLVFGKIYEINVFLWKEIIRGYAWNGICQETLNLYYEMLRVGIQPDSFTFSFVLKACAGLSTL